MHSKHIYIFLQKYDNLSIIYKTIYHHYFGIVSSFTLCHKKNDTNSKKIRQLTNYYPTYKKSLVHH